MEHEIIEYEVIGSTNDELKKAALAGAREGTVVTALAQTRGKGRRGRTFVSPRGGLYLSLLLRPDDTEHITAMTAVAARRAIKALCGAETGIKWPNDLYLNGKKICGILTESTFLGDDRPAFTVVGIGVNIKSAGFPDEIASTASSLEDQGFIVDRKKLINMFLAEFDRSYCRKENWIDEYRAGSVITGKNITVISASGKYPAFAEGIDDDGHLVIVLKDGEKRTLISGEVSIRDEDDICGAL